ncbi:hypothetical protein RB195_007337 [Necator americanus]|uniref:Uncharacterized protein n=1 Tax=Necator americanus TaxID=51031 RepID=A0ABR1BWS3_NECAM
MSFWPDYTFFGWVPQAEKDFDIPEIGSLAEGEDPERLGKHVARLCFYNARTVFSNGAIAAERINFTAIALQQNKCGRSDVRQMNDGTIIIRGEKISEERIQVFNLF